MAASASAAAGEEDWVLPSEVEVLESIYLDELQVVKGNGRSSPWEIYITLHPATAEDQDSQYVCFTLVLQVPAQYPNEVPQISIRNPRGLSDEQIHKISQALSHVANAGLGTAMLYELIEKGKEILTDNNIPHGQCVICLYGFQEKEAFTKTPCYHYFHCHCLARYIQHMEHELQAQGQEQERQHAATKQKAVGVQCPVCREPLVYDLASLKAAPEPQQPMELYQPNAESLRQQEERKRLYQRQQERGGIIDLEAERNRYFISLQQPPAPLEPESAVDASRGSHPPSALDTELSTSSTAQPNLSAPLPVASQHTCEKIPGAGPNQQRLGETPKTMLDPPRAGRGPWRQPERRHLKGGECNAHKGTNDTQELPPPEGPLKEPMDLKPEPCSQGVEGPPQEKGPGTWQGPPPRRTRDCARWERSKGRTPGSSYPRLPRGRGAYRPGTRREPLSLESEDGS
ncbi:E3 ubiquitin-protein ligase RNF25 isoform X1 [Neofelis nebulosa]|uniref:E3 ubiquitin-protein ligase RNF25 n=1 Tax=Panthera leo TaxID=9689 RepID=A0A8C8Y6J3_PANLE|nr:E3 ubiquitin-protein ligase RNF25 isoform X1 [Panthera leo]XP_042851281.1 E3 ubiquitin-protein ligase RNF25 isoform X1 [Panthera tigris]XP_058560874.1 E3 ubiquitin-protein ligase RNF25 isoform X1 [Neofelis nebulosa]